MSMTGESGVYKITNISNGKIYVGSTVNFQRRWQLHVKRLNDQKHHAHHLQAAWNKYGRNCFVFEVIECCEKSDLLTREQYYLDTLKPEYNTSLTAGSRLGIKERPEIIAKKSASAGISSRVRAEMLVYRLFLAGVTVETDAAKKYILGFDEIKRNYSGITILEREERHRNLYNEMIRGTNETC